MPHLKRTKLLYLTLFCNMDSKGGKCIKEMMYTEGVSKAVGCHFLITDQLYPCCQACIYAGSNTRLRTWKNISLNTLIALPDLITHLLKVLELCSWLLEPTVYMYAHADTHIQGRYWFISTSEHLESKDETTFSPVMSIDFVLIL